MIWLAENEFGIALPVTGIGKSPTATVASKPEPRPLEITSKEDRDEARRALQILWDVTAGLPGIEFPGKEQRQAQRTLIHTLAQLLLGPDVDFMERY